ncbi:hypothetical protein [Lysinibacillus odysseyi]|uniref:Uncharacterized protein n=1 Tax=Lysinibacillus odysseyi 34hs-1 = NBRC 100172 TaxID=1220589 RepID=A0A0A3II24_9BACI|nr:hypothetical protein [Lysinibacillus odysseyi]KGR84421.1 hypothetical protein CD32_12590 [Lysinibacillus odysseyi 34hs-1 = NBRC 100172]
MNIADKMKVILSKRKQLHLNDDYGIYKSWNEITEVLSENEEKAIRYLENCSKEDLYYISEVFEDIAEKLQSKKLIASLRRLDRKYPELEMTQDIDLAESYIETS